MDRAEVGGTLRYRSGIGLGLFVTWCCGVVAMHVTELRGFGPGNGCLVFKFEKGRAMLAGGGWGRGWDALYVRIAELNPDARL